MLAAVGRRPRAPRPPRVEGAAAVGGLGPLVLTLGAGQAERATAFDLLPLFCVHIGGRIDWMCGLGACGWRVTFVMMLLWVDSVTDRSTDRGGGRQPKYGGS